MDRDWSFDVECSTLPGEIVCLTGSCPELGCWGVNDLVRMKPADDADFKKSGWTE